MISLDSERWASLSHAYGEASDIPQLLRDLAALPAEVAGDQTEPYFSLWSALCHQGDVYSASFAAVPHIVALMEREPLRTPMTLHLMIACVEIARAKGRGPQVPADLLEPYLDALRKVPAVVGASSAQQWDHWYCGAALASVAAAMGHPQCAEAVLELDPENVHQILREKNGE